MSVFHVHEWLALELIDANICAVGELIEKRGLKFVICDINSNFCLLKMRKLMSLFT